LQPSKQDKLWILLHLQRHALSFLLCPSRALEIYN
jgi:hypothetical protein